ncbi:MAG: hypothetical protein AMXMBFR58_03880 [Phycisphaerae bacterium]
MRERRRPRPRRLILRARARVPTLQIWEAAHPGILANGTNPGVSRECPASPAIRRAPTVEHPARQRRRRGTAIAVCSLAANAVDVSIRQRSPVTLPDNRALCSIRTARGT